MSYDLPKIIIAGGTLTQELADAIAYKFGDFSYLRCYMKKPEDYSKFAAATDANAIVFVDPYQAIEANTKFCVPTYYVTLSALSHNLKIKKWV